MKIMERHIGKVRPGRWTDLEQVEKKYDALEKPWGFPPKRRYRALYGGYPRAVYISEREWDGTATRDTLLEKAFASSEWMALEQDLNSVLDSLQIEIYQVLD